MNLALLSKLPPAVQALLGGLGTALLTAGPLVDDGVKASEAIAIALAFLSGSGLTAVKPNTKSDEPEADEPLAVEHADEAMEFVTE